MLAITLHEPWASLITVGAKRFETRSWAPPRSLIGQRIAIHAAKRKVNLLELSGEVCDAVNDVMGTDKWMKFLPLGCVLCTATLKDVYKIVGGSEMDGTAFVTRMDGSRLVLRREEIRNELLFGNLGFGRYAWVLEDVEKLERPIWAKGKQGFWHWEHGEEKTA